MQGRDSLCRTYLRQSVQAQTFTYFASFVVLLVNGKHSEKRET
jgi:hypothetical protein